MQCKIDAYGWYLPFDAVDYFQVIETSPGSMPSRIPGELFPLWDGKQWLMAVYIAPPVIVPEPQPPAFEPVILMVQAMRDKRKSGGVPVDGKWFHSDDSSRIQQLGLVMMGADVPAVPWKTMDGTFVTMSAPLAKAIFTGAASLDMALFAVAEQHCENLRTVVDPLVYDYTTGWPERFIK